jgi:uncharacterized OB-fold protein
VTLDAHVCPNGHVTYPGHALCPECGDRQTDTVDLAGRTGEVVTWTHSTATPPGVREPNTLAIVEFDVSDAAEGEETVRAIGGVTTEDVETGETVEPVYVEQLRHPEAGIRDPEGQDWDGYRFEPV